MSRKFLVPLQYPVGSYAAGKVLTSDASGNISWQPIPLTAGGSTSQVQFNGSGLLTGDSNFVWDNTNKYLGIGMTPGVNLDVTGKTRLQGTAYPVLDVLRNTSGTNARYSTLRFAATTTADMVDGFGVGVEFALADSGVGTTKIATIGAIRAGADDAGTIVFEPGAGSGVYTERMRIQANGRVGIANTNPQYQLDVGGDINIPTGSSFRINGVALSTGGGSGDVTGPSSAVADNVALFNGTTGKIIKDSGYPLIPWDRDTDTGAGLNGVVRIRHGTDNFLANPDFEAWNNGTTVAPIGWTLGGDATVSRVPSISVGQYAAQIVFGTANTGELYQSIGSATVVDYTYTMYYKRTAGSGSARLVAQNADSPYQEFASYTLQTDGVLRLAALTVKPTAGTNLRFAIKSGGTVASTWQIDECMLQESKGVATTFTGKHIDDNTTQNIFGTKLFSLQKTYNGGFKLFDPTNVYDVTVQTSGSTSANRTINLPASTDADILTTGAYSGAVVRVIHGATASTARPAGATYVEWVGSVAPTNANTTNDTWIDTS